MYIQVLLLPCHLHVTIFYHHQVLFFLFSNITLLLSLCSLSKAEMLVLNIPCILSTNKFYISEVEMKCFIIVLSLLKHLYIATVQFVEFSGFEFLNDLMLGKEDGESCFASSYITDHSGDQVLLQNFL